VRWGVRRSAPFRRLAIAMDDLFYGKNPAPAEPPGWLRRTPAERVGEIPHEGP